ncbi:PhzF family phenazine biosynthesis protein [Quadrisphaera sp. DSM 44207]|uniref:PhzF family phenazine biosynthesis protein n=1 Tax=Quadrisphaera sp. DSM 44207 TaxID=1881057 RepID=UPI000882FBBB|nr:PhzF family phenazine biosynthesis protein [Quadrisphaera sp. DSM 44207]SDQ71713.1 trans-2,3-dihydro-3-hydroxyanthranilate isomerase [Quadrisphaera sp. DSM 44207]
MPEQPPSLEFEVVDVFTDRPFAGNPLAVVLGADDLATGQLQALAAEFNLSETAFPMAPTAAERARGAHYRLRIFTPGTELPFAGHPSVGTAWLLARRGALAPGRAVQACGAGDLPLEVSADGGPVRLTGGAPAQRGDVDPAPLLAALGLEPADLDPQLPGRAAAVAGTGVDQAHLFVRPGALAALRPDAGALERLPHRVPLTGTAPLAGLLAVAWGGPDGSGRWSARVRMLGTGIGVAEDPATGSAALGLGVSAVAAGLLPGEGTSELVVTQGVEMGRPSRLEVRVRAAGGRAAEVSVQGAVVPVSSGRIAVPPASHGR